MAEPTTGVRFAGVLRDGSGNLITSGVTANSYNIGTTTPTRGTEDSTFTSGQFAIADSGFGRFDVKIVNGSEQIWWSSLAEVQVTSLQARNPAATTAGLEVFSTENTNTSLVAVFGFRPSTESSGVETAQEPSDDDEAYINFELSNANSTPQQWTAGKFTWVGTTVADGSEAGRLEWDVMTGGSLATEMTLTGALLDLQNNAITTTGLVTAGSLTVSGTTTLNGNLVLGDAAADTLDITAAATVSTDLKFADDIDLALGTGADILVRNRSTAAAANLEITDLIIGTSVHPGVAANSLVASNITASGDMMFLTNRGGNSEAHMLFDASAGDTYFYARGVQQLKLTGGGASVFAGDVTVSGELQTANIGYTDGDNAITIADGGGVTFAQTVTVGVDDTGKDVKFFGASAGAYMEWDESEDQLRIMGASADATTSTGKLLLATSLTDINANDVLGKIDFQAPHEAGGTDAITVAASIQAIAQGTFSGSVNATDMIFYTGHSEAATEKFRFTSQGELGIGGANYGSDGEVLTSGGAGAAPTWAAAGSVSGAQTGITTILNTGAKIGRDTQNLIDFATTDNKIILRVNNVNEVELVENALQPTTNDGVALGTTSLGWSDLHLASAGVINWVNGEMTITESDANTLTVAGGTFATAALTATTINGVGDATVTSGDVVVATAGKGIDFSANTGAAGEASAILDWYEEGTWTPQLADNSGDGTEASYSQQVGYYTRIGNIVFFTLNLITTSLGTLTGGHGAKIQGLPFAANNDTRNDTAIVPGYASGLAIASGTKVGGFVTINTSHMELYLWDGTGGPSLMTIDEWSADGRMSIQGHYRV